MMVAHIECDIEQLGVTLNMDPCTHCAKSMMMAHIGCNIPGTTMKSKGHGLEGQGIPKSMVSGAVQTKSNEADIFTKRVTINSDVVTCDEKGTTELSNFFSARL